MAFRVKCQQLVQGRHWHRGLDMSARDTKWESKGEKEQNEASLNEVVYTPNTLAIHSAFVEDPTSTLYSCRHPGRFLDRQ